MILNSDSILKKLRNAKDWQIAINNDYSWRYRWERIKINHEINKGNNGLNNDNKTSYLTYFLCKDKHKILSIISIRFSLNHCSLFTLNEISTFTLMFFLVNTINLLISVIYPEENLNFLLRKNQNKRKRDNGRRHVIT